MRDVVAVGRRHLPRGWSDLGLQVSIWLGFGLLYQVARGLADRGDPTRAFANAIKVIDFEQRAGALWELTAQRAMSSSHVLEHLATWTYWNSEFTVITSTLLFVYLRRHEMFTRFRNAILATNVLGLVGYVLLPTAPPRMFPSYGFIDRLTGHESGVVQLAANPYAAMPSLHAADALIVGVVMFTVCRHWLARALWAVWPAWVWFTVMATANHYWLDVAGGILVALVGMSLAWGRAQHAAVAEAAA